MDNNKILANIVELAQKLDNGEVDENSKLYEIASKAQAALFKTEEGRVELSELVSQYLDDTFNKHDITPLILQMKHFKYGERPLFKTHKKGIVAYKTARNSLVPMSQNYETEFTMEFENLGVHISAPKMDLKTGRLSTFANLIKDSQEAIERIRIADVWKLVTQTYNATSNKDNYFKTNTVNDKALDSAINRVRKKVGGRPVIMADYDLMTEVEKFDKFKGLEEVYKEIKSFGLLGTYRGCKMVYLPEILNPVTEESIVPTDKIMVIGQKIGYAATLGEPVTDQKNNFDDQTWEYRYDKEVGNVVTKPEGLAVVHIVSENA